ncbi:lysylphosphatidylglycerol synthase domain-containing protein [Hyunsoonleella pacifica]|nr:lysylphosphatidylglycerol synthase domain-containing protein [Hyunsoonleella pacifica]
MTILQLEMLHNSLPYKTKQFFFVLIKLSIVIGAGYFIYEKLAKNDTLSFSSFIQFTSKNGVFTLKNILFLMILSFFNWFLEILKWQLLVNSVHKINFKNALAQSLGALTASLFTPNRIGEYGAKAIYYIPSLRKKIMLTNLISNMLQMSVTVLFGIFGFVLFVSKYEVSIDYYKITRFTLISILVIIFASLGIKQNRFKIKGFSIQKLKTFVITFPKSKLLYGFILSLLRYMIFSFQFFFILQLFKVNLSYFEAMTIITSMYLISSVIPSIFIFDVIIKGSVAIFLFSFLYIAPITIVCTVTLMWLSNFAIPSCLGSFYVLNFKLPKTNK